eukprot:5097014-Amphidinium_carterae.1
MCNETFTWSCHQKAHITVMMSSRCVDFCYAAGQYETARRHIEHDSNHVQSVQNVQYLRGLCPHPLSLGQSIEHDCGHDQYVQYVQSLRVSGQDIAYEVGLKPQRD